MGAPPSETGACHVSTTRPTPGDAMRLRGAEGEAGGMNGESALTAPERWFATYPYPLAPSRATPAAQLAPGIAAATRGRVATPNRRHASRPVDLRDGARVGVRHVAVAVCTVIRNAMGTAPNRDGGQDSSPVNHADVVRALVRDINVTVSAVIRDAGGIATDRDRRHHGGPVNHADVVRASVRHIDVPASAVIRDAGGIATDRDCRHHDAARRSRREGDGDVERRAVHRNGP